MLCYGARITLPELELFALAAGVGAGAATPLHGANGHRRTIGDRILDLNAAAADLNPDRRRDAAP